MVIERVTASRKRRRRGTHQMYRVAPEDSLKVAESSFRREDVDGKELAPGAGQPPKRAHQQFPGSEVPLETT